MLQNARTLGPMAGQPGRRRKRAEILAQICGYLRVGMPREIACSLSGVARTTLWRWTETSNAVTLQVQEAEASAIAGAVAVVIQAMQRGDWRAAVWYLERRASKDFAAASAPDVEAAARELALREGLDPQLVLDELRRLRSGPK